MKNLYLILLFAFFPILLYGIHTLHFVPSLWKLPFYLTVLCDIFLIFLGIILLKRNAELNYKTKRYKELWLRFLTSWLMVWIFIWVLIPLTMYNFVVEQPEKEVKIANRVFQLYSMGHKRHRETIIYEQNGSYFMTQVAELPFAFDIIQVDIQEHFIVFIVNQKVVRSIPIQ